MISAATYTPLMAGLAILAQLFSAVLVVVLLTKSSSRLVKQLRLTHTHFILSAYAVTMFATIGSLIYSDVLGYNPCKMCWYQRIAMYPQAVLYLVALVNQDKRIRDYGLALSFVGMLLAAYHYLLQIGVITTTACSTVGFSISCSENFGMTFGYITIPMMALSAFTLISLIWLVHWQAFKRVDQNL